MSLKETHKLINEELLATESELNDFLHAIEKMAAKDNNGLGTLLAAKKDFFKAAFPKLADHLVQLKKDERSELDAISKLLSQQIKQLKKAKDTATSDNFLLEYKRKDLLLLANSLEEANEEITAKNTVLEEQKERISEQADKIRKASEEILEKNNELEQQKESILDQADYLHEANKTITSMHAEVQKQKDEILKKNKELVKLNNEKNNLISIVAHDLKSPLNQIKGLISVIKVSANTLDEGTKNYINIIESSATRLNEMIAKILDIEAIESKSLNLDIQQSDLSELLANCADRFQIIAQNKQITLHVDIEEGLTAAVDPEYVIQVFENLISNALKFSPKFVNIYISLFEKDGQVICQVKDEGPGITKEDMKKLFGKYQKLSAKPTANETSTGLGLSIVKKFVEAMNGKIWCESKAGEGASFYVSFKSG